MVVQIEIPVDKVVVKQVPFTVEKITYQVGHPSADEYL